MKALFIDGSPAPSSRVGILLQAMRSRLEARNVEAVSIALLDSQLPINNPAYHNRPQDSPHQGVREFVAQVKEAAIIVLGTPLYHGSYSGLLKMAIDHLPDDAFAGKRVVIVSNSSSARSAAQAAQELVPVVRALKGEVLNRLIGTCREDYGVQDEIFQIVDPDIIKRLDLVADELSPLPIR